MSIILKGGASQYLANVNSDGELLVAADNQVYNGTANEKARTANSTDGTSGVGVPAAGLLGFDGTSWRRVKVGTGGDVAVSITNPNAVASSSFATISPYGALNVSIDPTLLFGEIFDVLDLVNKWSSVGTITPAITNSNLAVANATANATVSLSSVPTFTTTTSVTVGAKIVLESGAFGTGTHRFFGLGLASGAGTAAAPLTEAVGFEIDTAGSMRACIYTGGVRTFSQVVATTSDGQAHRYAISTRADITFFYIDTFDVPTAFARTGPSVQNLPVRIASLNGAVLAGNAPTMNVTGIVVYDAARQSTNLSDGTYPWRRAKIDATGALNVVNRPADLAVTATSASAGASAVATLPAAGTGMYHYITNIEIVRYVTLALGGSATPNTVTSTNLPGALAWWTASAGGIGTITDRVQETYAGAPLRSVATNTATTITAPATGSVIWRVTVNYFTAP